MDKERVLELQEKLMHLQKEMYDTMCEMGVNQSIWKSGEQDKIWVQIWPPDDRRKLFRKMEFDSEL